MAALFGFLVGGVLGVYLLHALWEFVLFKRVFNDPVAGKLASVLFAYLTASLLYGFGSADGGPFNPLGFVVYLLPALVVGVLAYRRGVKIRSASTNSGVFQ